MRIVRVETKSQPADLLTKGRHTAGEHTHLMSKLGIHDMSREWDTVMYQGEELD